MDARILVTDRERAENPTLEVAHEAVFTGWRRLSRWIESHAGELRVCRSLAMAARDWQQAGSPLLSSICRIAPHSSNTVGFVPRARWARMPRSFRVFWGRQGGASGSGAVSWPWWCS